MYACGTYMVCMNIEHILTVIWSIYLAIAAIAMHIIVIIYKYLLLNLYTTACIINIDKYYLLVLFFYHKYIILFLWKKNLC